MIEFNISSKSFTSIDITRFTLFSLSLNNFDNLTTCTRFDPNVSIDGCKTVLRAASSCIESFRVNIVSQKEI